MAIHGRVDRAIIDTDESARVAKQLAEDEAQTIKKHEPRAAEAPARRLSVEEERELEGLRTRLTNAVRRTGLSPADVEDVVQETYARAIKDMLAGGYNREHQLYTWLFRIARNFIIDRSRRHYIKRHSSLSGETTFDDLPGKAMDPEEELLKKETDEAVAHAIEKLPLVLRTVVKLRQDDLEFKEIGRRLGISENTAKTRFYRAQRILSGDEELAA